MITLESCFLSTCKKFKLAQSEIEEIFEFVMGFKMPDTFMMKPDFELSKNQFGVIESLCLLVQGGPPLAYVTGKKNFYGYDFWCLPGVLIPRFDTEVLVDHALKEIKNRNLQSVIDLGCGSGCVGLTIALEAKDSNVVGVDISERAVALTKKNQQQLKVKRYETLKADMRSLPKEIGSFDLIVSNPPYIAKSDKRVDASVFKYEPHLALYGEDDGLEFYQAIAQFGFKALNEGGSIMVEFSPFISQQVVSTFQELGYHCEEVINDLQQHQRVGHFRIKESSS